jgi:hypothetical protein
MATATRVAGDKEGNGSKSDGDDEKGGGQATATVMATKRAMAAAMRVACNEEGDGDNNEGDGDKGGGRASATRAMAMAMVTVPTWAIVTTMKLAGDKKGKGKGGKGNGNGDEGGGQQRRQGQQGDGDGNKGGR